MINFKHFKSALLVGALSLSMVFTAACSKKTDNSSNSSNEFSKSLVVTVGDSKLYLDEMMYYIYAIEAEGNYYEQMYQQSYGMSYWDSEFEEGITMRDQTKTFLMDTAVMYEVLYSEALKADFSLSEEEKAESKTNAEQIMSNMTEEQLKITGFNEDVLVRVQEKLILGEKFYNKIQEEVDLDETAIAASVNKDNYKEYTTEYIYAPFKNYNDAGQIVEVTADEKAVLKETMDKALKQVQAGKSFSEFASDDTVETSTLVFLKDGNDVEKEYNAAASTLKNDEISDQIVETEYGYYIIKMVDTESTTKYDAAIEEAKSLAAQEAFDTEYNKIVENYKHTVNEEVWGPLVMGTVTVVPTATTDTTTSGDATESTGK